MEAFNGCEMYDINTTAVLGEVLAAQKDFGEEAYNSLDTEIEKIMNYSKFEEKVRVIKYSASNHFYIVKNFERWRKTETSKEYLKLGYYVKPNDFKEGEREKWVKEIEEVLRRANTPPENRSKALFNDKGEINIDNSNYDYYQLLKKEGRVENERNEILEAERWAYDMYSFEDSSITLSYSQDDPDEKKSFTVLFTWVLAVIELVYLDDFLAYHFNENFDRNSDKFGRFLDIVISDKQYKILDEDCIRLVQKWIDSNPYKIEINNSESKIIENINERGKPGRKPKEKLLIPIKSQREKNDKRTILSKEDTGRLFSLLASLNCVFNNSDEISKDSFSKAIQCLTGYSAGQMEECLIYDSLIPKNKSEKMKRIDDIKELIMSKL